jgi:tartrate-resistant acid phosphatase type 5
MARLLDRCAALCLAVAGSWIAGCGSGGGQQMAAGTTGSGAGATTGSGSGASGTTSNTSTGAGGAGTTTTSGSGGEASTSAGTGGAGGASTSSSTGTAGAPPVVKILALGDTGEGNNTQYAVGAQMSAKCGAVGGCNAVLILGDNFYDNGVQSTSDSLWKVAFEDPYDQPNLNGLPFYVVLGNHDYGLTSTGDKQKQIDYSSLPVGPGPNQRLSDKWYLPSAWYDVQIGPLHVFALDTQDFSSTQRTQMAAKVAASTATWKIVTGHHPRYTSGQHYWDNQPLGWAGMYDLLEEVYCGADMLLTGHDHNREFIDKGRDDDCPNTHFVVSGAGSKVRDKGFTPDDSHQLYFDDGTEGFAYIEIDGPTLKLEFIDVMGVVNYTKIITK